MRCAQLLTVTTRAPSVATQHIEQQPGKREMAEVIGAELHLEAVGGLPVRNRHDAGVVDQMCSAGCC